MTDLRPSDPHAAHDRCKHGYSVRDDDPTVQECIDSESAAATSRLRAVWRAVRDFVAPDLRGKLAALDDDKLLLLRESIYRDPRGLKGVHIRMVTDECARRGL